MSEMIERVAKAIYEGRNGRGAVPFRHQLKTHQEPYLADARAAIEAMKGIDPVLIEGPSTGFGVADWNITIDNILFSAALSPSGEK